jgi:hypothetical protein
MHRRRYLILIVEIVDGRHFLRDRIPGIIQIPEWRIEGTPRRFAFIRYG